MKTHLKVKIMALGAEAKIIKAQERKWLKVPFIHDNVKVPHPLFLNLRHHRLYEVRRECRSAHIAYGYMRGRPYKRIENKCHEPPNWHRVEQIAAKYWRGHVSLLTVEERKQLAEALKAWAEADLPTHEDVRGILKDT